MIRLHEVAEQYREFAEGLEDMLALVDEGEMEEAAIWDTLEAIEGELSQKTDALATIYKSLKYECAALGEEIKKAQERKRIKEARAERLLAYIGSVLTSCGKKKIETPFCVISTRRTQRVTIDDEASFIEWAQEYYPELLRFRAPEADKTAIKARLAQGAAVQGARLEEHASVSIK